VDFRLVQQLVTLKDLERHYDVILHLSDWWHDFWSSLRRTGYR